MQRVFIALLLLVVGCGGSPSADTGDSTRFADVPRIVALGDLHGDVDATRRALRLAGAIDEMDHWTGGELVVVQTGDQLDRGDHEQEILDLLDRLRGEAQRAGGALHVLNGNHEVMNVSLDLRYVTEGGFADFEDAVDMPSDDTRLLEYEEGRRARVVAFRPGGPYCDLLARRNIITIIGPTVFVHGGVTPAHVEYGLERINSEVRSWMRGETSRPDTILGGDGPIWARNYSLDVEADDCAELEAVLGEIGVARMVVGHTVQEEGIRSYCDGRVWCIDSGMSAHYGGRVQVLEIVGDQVRLLDEGH